MKISSSPPPKTTRLEMSGVTTLINAMLQKKGTATPPDSRAVNPLETLQAVEGALRKKFPLATLLFVEADPTIGLPPAGDEDQTGFTALTPITKPDVSEAKNPETPEIQKPDLNELLEILKGLDSDQLKDLLIPLLGEMDDEFLKQVLQHLPDEKEDAVAIGVAALRQRVERNAQVSLDIKKQLRLQIAGKIFEAKGIDINEFQDPKDLLKASEGIAATDVFNGLAKLLSDEPAYKGRDILEVMEETGAGEDLEKLSVLIHAAIRDKVDEIREEKRKEEREKQIILKSIVELVRSRKTSVDLTSAIAGSISRYSKAAGINDTDLLKKFNTDIDGLVNLIYSACNKPAKKR